MASLNDHFLSIASKGNSAGELWEPQRKYDHVLHITDIQPSYGTSSGRTLVLAMLGGFRPQESVQEAEIQHGHTVARVPSKIDRESGEVRCVDYVDPNTAEMIYNWMDSMRDKDTGVIQMAQKYMKEGYVLAYYTDRSRARQWNLIDCWPVSVMLNEWDYSDSSAQEISVTIRYKTFKYVGLTTI